MIAVLVHYIERTSGGYEQELRQAFVRACKLHDFDLTIICGGPLDDPARENCLSNQLYELIDDTHFDGAIVLTIGVCRHVPSHQLFERLPRLRSLAVCSIGMVLDQVPSVVADNDAGMAAAIEHLITQHGRRHLAFLGATWPDVDIDRRRELFLEIAARHGIVIPLHRLCECWLEPSSAELAIERLLELDPSIDAIVAANDGAALGTIRALQRLRIRVPEQISVTGFDDLPMARLIEPGVTSVSQPLDAMAVAAVKCLALQLAGAVPPLVTRLPSTLILRRSCGCVAHPDRTQTVEELSFAARRAYIERLELETTYGQILELARLLSVAADARSLEQQIADGLPKIQPGDCFVAFFSDETHASLRPILPRRFAEGGSVLSANAAFLSHLGDEAQPRALLVLGLTCQSELLGLIAFELSDYCVDYPAVASHIAGAKEVVKLREEVIHQTLLAERSVQERQAAADRSRATSALASGVAHDLNNALGSLVSLSEVVCDEITEHFGSGRPLGTDTVDDLQTIRSSALRATETIKDLMTLGRIGRTRQEPFDLIRLTRSIVDAQNSALTKRQACPVNLTLDGPERDLIVAGSEPHVERAIGNVLRNALEAAGGNGEVTVAISTLQLEHRLKLRESVPPGSYAVISINDNGPGIDTESQRRIFEPFFSTKRLGESSGSGLGLAIVHSVVKEHLGYIDLVSQVGEGARFSLYFPRLHLAPEVRPSVVPVALGSARILVVDDDLTQLRTARRVLSRSGYDVTTMASGARAYELVAMESQQRVNLEAALPQARTTSSYDLLIMDLALSEDEDGLQIFNRIRKLFPKQKGILASGHAFVDHEEQIRAANLVWLPKPYTVESLTTAIQTALRD